MISKKQIAGCWFPSSDFASSWAIPTAIWQVPALCWPNLTILKWLECIFKPVVGIAGENLDWSCRSHRLEHTITSTIIIMMLKIVAISQEKMRLSGYLSWSFTSRIWTVFAYLHDLTDLQAPEMCFLYGDLYACSKCCGKLYKVCFSCACTYVTLCMLCNFC